MTTHLPIYLDNQATTPCDPQVMEAMVPYFTEKFGNAASRSHVFGYHANSATEHGRLQVAELISASPKEIIFTSGATESNNLAILGHARAKSVQGKHIITAQTEHKAVLDPCAVLAQEGFDVTILSVDGNGRIDLDALEQAIRPDTTLVSIMAVNNEIGTIQDIEAIGTLCHSHGVTFHTDAAQACPYIKIDVTKMHIDLLSLSAHKMYGPKGIGALYVRRGRPQIQVQPLIHGGGHERGMRSGTLPVPLIVGFGMAAKLALEASNNGSTQNIQDLRDRLWQGLKDRLQDVQLNGSMEHRTASNLNISFKDVEAQALMMGVRDIAISSGSACTSATLEPSHVLEAIGISPERAHSSLRFGLGRWTTAEDIDYVIENIGKKVIELREMHPMYNVTGIKNLNNS